MTARRNPQPISRREVFRVGGVTLSLAAIVAACGENRDGDTDPGRVGNAVPVTAIPDYEVNDVVLLRTASSLELTAVELYNTAKGIVDFDESTTALLDRLIANHTATAAKMGELTLAAGGEAWNDTNPWIMERVIEPILETIGASDDIPRDVMSLAITLENLAAATHQTLTGLLDTSEQRTAVAMAAAEESRHSAALVLDVYGTANRFSPLLVGEEDTRTTDNVRRQYAVASQFGSVAQIELIVGPADINGVRTTYTLATPAANSFVYEEL
jgi:hypothetical protein